MVCRVLRLGAPLLRGRSVTVFTKHRHRFCQVEAKQICSVLMRTALIVLAMLATPVLASQTVWKWVDEQGVTHFSDRPVPGATKVEISSSNRSDVQSSSSGRTYTSPSPAPATQYQDFEIWKPAEGEVFINAGGQVPVNIRLNPQLNGNDTLSLYLDGRLVEGFPENTTEYSLTNIARGQHSVLARITDGNGREVKTTAAVHFTVRQESIAQPPVGPALKAPPKPQPHKPGPSSSLPSTQPSYGDLNGMHPKIDPRTNRPPKG
jgi:Domain of unknown function (DUF4124)